MSNKTKTCPFCSEEILVTAKNVNTVENGYKMEI